MNDERNNTLAEVYRKLAKQKKCDIRKTLAECKYFDMAPVIEKKMKLKLAEVWKKYLR